MNRKKEQIKNIVLAALILLLLGQIKLTWTYGSHGQQGNVFSAVGQLFGKTAIGLDQEMDCAAYPIELAVCSENGFYAKRSGDMQGDFSSVIPILQCALQRVGEFAKVEDFGEDLDQPLIYVRYDGEIPLSLLCDWIGCQDQAWDFTLGSLLVVRRTDGDSFLYLRDSRTHVLYRAKTEVDQPLFTQYTNIFSVGGGGFAWQLQYNKLLPESLIMDGTEKFSILRASVPAFDESGSQNSKQQLLEAFSYNPYTVKSYEENAGTATVFVENQSTLTLGKDGHVVFEANNLGGGISVTPEDGDTMAECGEYAGEMVQNVLKSFGGGRAYLAGVYQDGDVTSFVFQQMRGGVPVDDAVHGYFAKLYFQNGRLIQGDFYLRQYEETGEILGLMPGKQVAQLVTGRGEVSVRYIDTGEERIIPQWKQMN